MMSDVPAKLTNVPFLLLALERSVTKVSAVCVEHIEKETLLEGHSSSVLL